MRVGDDEDGISGKAIQAANNFGKDFAPVWWVLSFLLLLSLLVGRFFGRFGSCLPYHLYTGCCHHVACECGKEVFIFPRSIDGKCVCVEEGVGDELFPNKLFPFQTIPRLVVLCGIRAKMTVGSVAYWLI